MKCAVEQTLAVIELGERQDRVRELAMLGLLDEAMADDHVVRDRLRVFQDAKRVLRRDVDEASAREGRAFLGTLRVGGADLGATVEDRLDDLGMRPQEQLPGEEPRRVDAARGELEARKQVPRRGRRIDPRDST